MSARDPIRSSVISQSEMMRDNSLFLSSLDYPLCLRSSEGVFLYSNPKFAECIKGYEYSIEDWFNRLPFETRCELLSCELNAFASSRVATYIHLEIDNSYQYSVLFHKVAVNGFECAAWSFFDKVLFNEKDFYPGLKKRINGTGFRNPALILEPSCYKVFCLYFSGLTHEFISSLLMINIGTSKNRISKAYSLLGISGRDEMILYLKSNSYLQSVMGYAFYLISLYSEERIMNAVKKAC